MSYILEALKKSEQQRQQEKTMPQLHDLQPVPVPYAQEKPKQTNWLYLAAIFALLGIGITYFLYIRYQGSTSAQVPRVTIRPLAVQSNFGNEKPDVRNQTDQPTALSVQTETQPLPEQTATASKSQQDLNPAKDATASQLTEEDTEVIEPAPLYTEGDLPTTQPLPKTIPSKYASIPFLEELSVSFQKQVPELKLAGHVYSPDPALRMILINSRIVRENDIIEKDFVLDEITPEGVVLRYGDTRFRLISD